MKAQKIFGCGSLGEAYISEISAPSLGGIPERWNAGLRVQYLVFINYFFKKGFPVFMDEVSAEKYEIIFSLRLVISSVAEGGKNVFCKWTAQSNTGPATGKKRVGPLICAGVREIAGCAARVPVGQFSKD